MCRGRTLHYNGMDAEHSQRELSPSGSLLVVKKGLPSFIANAHIALNFNAFSEKEKHESVWTQWKCAYIHTIHTCLHACISFSSGIPQWENGSGSDIRVLEGQSVLWDEQNKAN